MRIRDWSSDVCSSDLCGATILMGFLFGPSLASESWPLIFLGLAAALFVMGLVYGPLGSWLTGLFPVRVRYTGASVAFNAGGILGGAMEIGSASCRERVCQYV